LAVEFAIHLHKRLEEVLEILRGDPYPIICDGEFYKLLLLIDVYVQRYIAVLRGEFDCICRS
jgi:hypothetical protein